MDRNRKTRVILNGNAADWVEVLSGVPQGSVLGQLLFLIYTRKPCCRKGTAHCQTILEILTASIVLNGF